LLAMTDEFRHCERSEAIQSSLLLEQQRPFLANQRLDRSGDFCQQPRKQQFQANVIVKNVDRSADRLRKRDEPELQATVGPGLLLDGKELPELFLRRIDTGL